MFEPTRLRAADGLELRVDAGGALRIAWRGVADWLGPLHAGLAVPGAERREAPLRAVASRSGSDDLGGYGALELGYELGGLPLRTSVRAYAERPMLVLRTACEEALSGFGSGRIDEPRLAWPWLRPTQREAGGAPGDARSYGHQLTEFAFPTHGDGDFTGFLFAPHRPRLLLPLLLVAEEGALLLAPLAAFHELVAAVPHDETQREAGVRIGWHGDLAEVPSGFASELALLAGDGPRALLESWGALLRQRAATPPRGRYDDALLAGLSYWTDNGAVYYYRTAPGCDYTETLGRKLDELRADGVPVHSLQLDSWFYPHEQLRPVSAEGAAVVPPTGMLRWEPREDLFPRGLAPLRERAGVPLSFHSRHFSASSPYFERYEAWRDGGQAHPVDGALFDRLIEQAASWGGIVYEQDWMVESFLGVRGLREAPGRAAAWQRGMDAAAQRCGLSLQWCMATPADFMEGVALRQLTSIRTSGDYRYLFDSALNWVWFLHANALARALGLWPYKDVFLSHPPTPEGFGDELCEAEALLAALSAGPVGIGDQLGHTQRERVMRTCRADGVLIKPDVPIAALDRCFRRHGYFGGEPLLAEAFSDHPAGRFVYLVSMNASHASKQSGRPLRVRVDFAELGAARPRGPLVLFDWRRGRCELLPADGGFEEELAYQDFGFRVLCPLLPGEVTLLGDVSKYTTMGDRRIARLEAEDGELRFDVLGAPGEEVCVDGFARRAPRALGWTTRGSAELAARHDADSGRFQVRVPVGRDGVAAVTLSW